MDMNKLLKIINPILGIAFFIQVATIIAFKMSAEHHFAFQIHKYCGYTFLTLVFFHIVLNYKWIKATYLAK
ncbi:MAG: hypothetical protein QMC67_06300 [Candidatus Wallbacteria bacterium]